MADQDPPQAHESLEGTILRRIARRARDEARRSPAGVRIPFVPRSHPQPSWSALNEFATWLEDLADEYDAQEVYRDRLNW